MHGTSLKENYLYSNSTVSSLTGVNAVTLQAWEGCYGLTKLTCTDFLTFTRKHCRFNW